MTSLTPYRIISYILLPIAALLGIFGLGMFVFALVNPVVFIPALTFSCVVVYIILSFIFFMKAVENNKKCKSSLRKWITSTGIISVLFAGTTLFNCISLFYSPDLISSGISQSMSMQKNIAAVPMDLMVKVFKGVLYFMVFFAATLIIHVYETFKLLKQYAQSFEVNEKQQ